MKKLVRLTLTAIFVVACMISMAICIAAVQIFEGTGQYIMSDFENHDIAKQRAQQRAERDAQKHAGVAIKTFSRSINSELADDEVSAVMNGIIRVSDVKIVPVPFETNGEAGLMYRATLKAAIDTDGILDWFKKSDNEKVTIIHQNNELQKEIKKNDELIEDLKAKYNRATSQAEKDQIREQMSKADRDFLSIKKLEDGIKLNNAKNYTGAIKLYTEAIELSPNNYFIYLFRSSTYLTLKQYEKAIQDSNKVIELNPNMSTIYLAHVCIGSAYSGLNQFDNALQAFNEALKFNPDEDFKAIIYSFRGAIYVELKNYDQALEDCNRLIQLKPNDYMSYLLRTAVHIQLKNWNSAIDDANKAIQIKPNLLNAYKLRGGCYQKLGDDEKAREDFALVKALEKNPDIVEAYYNRGLAYFVVGYFNKTIADTTKAIQINPNYARAYVLRGVAYQKLGDNAKAEEDFAKAKALGFKFS